MKKNIAKFSAWLVLIVMLVMLVPGINLRMETENKNDNVIVSMHYATFETKVAEKKLNSTLEKFKNAGLNMVTIIEDDLNYLVAKGEITCIKYNVLGHKYDSEGIEMKALIKSVYPEIQYDHYVVIADEEKVKERLKNQLSKRYGKEEMIEIGSYKHMDMYVLKEGRLPLAEYAIGYDEDTIKKLKDKGFDITLVHKMKNYSKTEYLEDFERIVKEYDVKYINLKKDYSFAYDKSREIKKNYKRMAEIISENDATLVVTENADHLSNQKVFGYDYIFEEVAEKTGKIIRSYETYDQTHEDESRYKYRTEAFFNSTVDRNIRFITVTLLEPYGEDFAKCADYTFKSAKEFKEQIEEEGFTVNKGMNPTYYDGKNTFHSAICAVIMLMFVLIAFGLLTGIYNIFITLGVMLVSAAAFVLTFKLPDELVALYPTAYSALQPCFVMTVILCYINKAKEKLPAILLAVSSVVIMFVMLLIGSIGTATMLSGTNYYINNDIFRGIKLSLSLPLVYTAIIYYILFVKNKIKGSALIEQTQKFLVSEIKVYWVVLAVILGSIVMYYIKRSGNVNSISSLEQLMRTTLTEIFTARPRTKEFLVGYPSVVLLAYYTKKVDIDLLKWILAVGASILAASVTNSFCHVFTGFSIIVSRTINGLLVGIIVCVVAYIANIYFVKLVNKCLKSISKYTEMR